MAGNKSICLTLTGLWEPCDSAKLAQARKIRLASCQQLMNIRLMTNIEYQAVFLGIKHSLKGDRQLNNTQIGSQMAPGQGNAGDHELTDLFTQSKSL